MTRKPWHIHRTDKALTLSRLSPARFDIVADGALPTGDPLRYAHQIRQDMWRLLQGVRGFAPVVELRAHDGGWQVRAGGAVNGVVPPNAAATVAELLQNQSKRARWIAQANRSNQFSNQGKEDNQ
ncbi:hypothetical protein GG681_09255 [Epibacterium sp. SM1969]|uniref:Uncharacterized protein n=1 Tax=Tritonibacter aquimaris TaxID=2663379 RepID=A0A844ATX8_9RHOB|nr:hypothetical protein [Tritonibacter aquimaris]MQY42828.1 hypothetical protein [Tritonibacter aquimaris]